MQIAITHDVVDELDERESRVDARAQLDHVRTQLDVQQWRLESVGAIVTTIATGALLFDLFVDQQS